MKSDLASTGKLCNKCRLIFPNEFFRLRSYHDKTRKICRGCEQQKNDERKRKNRFRVKIRQTTRRHAKKYEKEYGMTTEEFKKDFGWDLDLMEHDARHTYKNGCVYCREPFSSMAHGLRDLTLDIHDPRIDPHYPTNVRWICSTCNGEKQRTPPELWGMILSCWKRWNDGDGPRQLPLC